MMKADCNKKPSKFSKKNPRGKASARGSDVNPNSVSVSLPRCGCARFKAGGVASVYVLVLYIRSSITGTHLPEMYHRTQAPNSDPVDAPAFEPASASGPSAVASAPSSSEQGTSTATPVLTFYCLYPVSHHFLPSYPAGLHSLVRNW
jgi:hypothetical protein